jgi:hypothetical protein
MLNTLINYVKSPTDTYAIIYKTKSNEWAVMDMCVRGIDFTSDSMIFWLDIETVLTVPLINANISFWLKPYVKYIN